jgi:hypothetical protein
MTDRQDRIVNLEFCEFSKTMFDMLVEASNCDVLFLADMVRKINLTQKSKLLKTHHYYSALDRNRSS